MEYIFFLYWITLHWRPDIYWFQSKVFHFFLRNVIWDNQVSTCFPRNDSDLRWEWLSSSTQCFIGLNALLHGPFQKIFFSWEPEFRVSASEIVSLLLSWISQPGGTDSTTTAVKPSRTWFRTARVKKETLMNPSAKLGYHFIKRWIQNWQFENIILSSIFIILLVVG